MLSRKRPVVQLTALLDLLFIMIFISLTSPMEPPPPPPPPTPPVSPPVEAQLDQVAEELARVEAENARYAAANDPLTTKEEPRENIGEYRKLFVANVHYKHGPTQYRYHETILYSADEHSGLYEYRVNLSGTRVIQTSGEPLLEADADRIKTCDEVVLTRDKIYQDCSIVFQRRKIIDCDRADAKTYQCKEQLTWFGIGKNRLVGNWEYRMELVKIYDPKLVM
jgi:hypothetical protein